MATIISDVNDLQNMSGDLTADYELDQDIDASITVGWNGGLGFDPIGSHPNSFNGTFDGKGFKITGLVIDRPLEDEVGLFGETFHSAGSIKNVTLENCNITGKDLVGALIGLDVSEASTPPIENCHSSGDVAGHNGVGGLVGYLFNGLIKCSSSCDVVDGVAAAGLEVSFGGLVGFLGGGAISECFATGDVVAPLSDEVGGLVGTLDNSAVDDCYATGAVTGDQYVGGFVGLNDGDIITNCYSIGTPTGNLNVGGFCGLDTDTITDCFWDTTTSGTAVSSGGTGKTTAQMKEIATFLEANWAISRIWNIVATCNSGYPCLINVNACCIPAMPPLDQTIIGDKVSLEAIRNLEMTYGGRDYVSKAGLWVHESRYHRNV